MKEHVHNSCERISGMISRSKLPDSMKSLLCNGVAMSAEATNGMTHEEKVQACSDNVYALYEVISILVVSIYSDKTSCTKWQLVAKFQWPITIIICVLIFALALNDQLAIVCTNAINAAK
jgi:hypothetical protein